MVAVRHAAAAGEAEEQAQRVVVGLLIHRHAALAGKDQGGQRLVAGGIQHAAGDIAGIAAIHTMAPAAVVLAGFQGVAAGLERRQARAGLRWRGSIRPERCRCSRDARCCCRSFSPPGRARISRRRPVFFFSGREQEQSFKVAIDSLARPAVFENERGGFVHDPARFRAVDRVGPAVAADGFELDHDLARGARPLDIECHLAVAALRRVDREPERMPRVLDRE